MKKILVFQHAANEGLGLFEEEMKIAGLSYDTLMVSDKAIFPSSVKLEEYGGFIVLGGPMSAYEEHRYPWLEKELMVIREILRQKKPYLGICLGAQLLAQAVGRGGRAYLGHKPEAGWSPVRLDDWFYKRNPLFFQIDPAKPHMVFQWHADTFDIPTQGYRLAWSDDYPNQAFCYQGNAIGLQFHVEMTPAMIKDWLSTNDGLYFAHTAGVSPQQIMADTEKHFAGMKDLAHKIFYGFASLIRENRRQAA